MYRGVREDLIPESGAYDITNGLLDNTGAVYRRGGSSYRSTVASGASIQFIWDGYLGANQRTVIASPTGFATLNADGSVSSIGGAGMARPGRAVELNGNLYFPGGTYYTGLALATAPKVAPFYAVAGSRLLAGNGNRVDFSTIPSLGTTFNATDYHLLADGEQIVGMHGLRDAVAVFTTGGIWIISGLAMNLTDAAGNVQQRLDRYSSDVVLWGDAGLAAFEGGLVVPALDGVWLLSLGVESEAPQAFAPISDPILALYRDYVRRGYWPGLATVYRSHYMLPILDINGCVDLLVCRLDAPGRPWTHLGGFGAKLAALAVLHPTTVPRAPLLVGGHANAGRVLNLNFFDPSSSSSADADGSAFSWSVQTRDYPTGALNQNVITRLRVAYDLADDPALGVPSIRATHVSGHAARGSAEWGAFSWGQADWAATSDATLLSGTAPLDPFGYKPYTWSLAKNERFGRFRLDCPDPAAYLTLRSLEMFVLSNGRII